MDEEALAAWTRIKRKLNEWQALAIDDPANMELVEQLDDDINVIEQLFIL